MPLVTKLIKVYHSYKGGKSVFQHFFDDIWKTLENRKMIFGLNFQWWEIFYSFTSSEKVYSAFDSQFYTHFNDFQLVDDTKWVWNWDKKKTVVWELFLENDWFFPFALDKDDDTDFVYNLFRTAENLDIINDKVSLFVEIIPLVEESFSFYFLSKLQYFLFKWKLRLKFFKYLFNHKIKKWDWKKEWDKYFKEKLNKELFQTKIYIVAQSNNKSLAEGRITSFFNNFMIFKNYPLNERKIKIHRDWILSYKPFKLSKNFNSYILSSEEISNIYAFPQNPKNETSLLKVKAKKLPLPVWVPTFDYEVLENGEIIPKEFPKDINIIWISDYRSIRVPVWIYDEDRLRHIYVIWKTWVWKSKFLMSLIVNDLKQWKWLAIIDPHGDLVEEAMMYVPANRKEDVIIFDPTDEEYPFQFNPLDVKENESKQILAKWFIDIFKKFFGANWNPKLEHVLRMVFLALLDKPGSTLFDIIRALTDKDFRYEMIETIEDDVVRNFWTNEFAWWSQQFNTEAIMPILNKVWQLLSIEIIKNIFASKENKLDLREVMDSKKILFIKLPKWKLQEEIMGFLWAMFVTKIYQTAMGRQSVPKKDRVPFFTYVDEFQNFATETFNEILSEARKYWLWLIVAHQYIKQIPSNISDALFGNVWTLVSFRISSEDALYMQKHFDPFLTSYDLANLDMREFYCKMLVKWQVKDPFSLRSLYIQEPDIDKNFIEELYEISRKKYCRSLQEAKQVVEEEQKDVLETIEEFAEPII